MEQLNFDVALIDTELSSTNGLDCYLALREVDPAITAIMVSPDDLLELAEEAVRRTAYTVITKPLQAEKLSEMIIQLRAQRVSGAIRKPGVDES